MDFLIKINEYGYFCRVPIFCKFIRHLFSYVSCTLLHDQDRKIWLKDERSRVCIDIRIFAEIKKTRNEVSYSVYNKF